MLELNYYTVNLIFDVIKWLLCWIGFESKFTVDGIFPKIQKWTHKCDESIISIYHTILFTTRFNLSWVFSSPKIHG
jgi:hypothetical protein